MGKISLIGWESNKSMYILSHILLRLPHQIANQIIKDSWYRTMKGDNGWQNNGYPLDHSYIISKFTGLIIS